MLLENCSSDGASRITKNGHHYTMMAEPAAGAAPPHPSEDAPGSEKVEDMIEKEPTKSTFIMAADFPPPEANDADTKKTEGIDDTVTATPIAASDATNDTDTKGTALERINADTKETTLEGIDTATSVAASGATNDTDRTETALEGIDTVTATPIADATKDASAVSNKSSTTLHTKKEEFVVSFEDLTCYVPGIPSNCCVSANNPITNYLEYYMGMQVQERDPFYSLDDCSGYVKSGEMCLVLGSNDASKSTLLKALSGRLNSQDELHGTILLNGMPLGKSNQGWRRLSPYVSASDTSHSPVLTVRETFTFAAQCSCTGPVDDKVDQLMDALGLTNVADTVVGDENLRGISGGQKRRVTVGEMMLDSGT